MATEYSIQKMVSDGTLSTIALGIQYLQRNDIYIRIAGEETPQSGAPSGYTWSFLDNTTLKILPVVPNGVEVVVYRRTDVDAMYNIYSQNAQFDEATIDENNTQLLYIAQEYLEQGATVGVDTIEFLRDDGSFTYYRLKRTDGSYSDEFYVPSAGSITKVLARESLRRSYAEAGYNLVDGSFEAGGVLVSANDVLLHEASGKAFSGPAGTVAAGTDPASGGFVDKSGGEGDELVSVRQPFAGALQRTQHDKNKELLSMADFSGASAAVTAAIASTNSILFNNPNSFDLTVGTGGQFATLMDAIYAAQRMRPLWKDGNNMCTIRLNSGFVLREQLTFGGAVDLSWIRITSQDSVVYADTSAFTLKVRTYYEYKYLFYIKDGANSPVFGFQIEENRANSDVCAFVVSQCSRLNFYPKSGARKFYVGIHASFGSTVMAYHTGSAADSGSVATNLPAGYYVCDFSYSVYSSIQATNSVIISMPISKFNNCQSEQAAVNLIYNCIGDFQGSNADDCQTGWNCRDSSILNIRDHMTRRCTNRGLTMIHNSHCDARRHDVDEASTVTGVTGKVLEPGVQKGFYGCALGARIDGAGTLDLAGNDMRNCGVAVNGDNGAVVSAKGLDVSGATECAFKCQGGSTIAVPRLCAENVAKLCELWYGTRLLSRWFYATTTVTFEQNTRFIDLRVGAELAAQNVVITGDCSLIAEAGSKMELHMATLKVRAVRSFTGSKVDLTASTMNPAFNRSQPSPGGPQYIISGGAFMNTVTCPNTDNSAKTFSTGTNNVGPAGIIFDATTSFDAVMIGDSLTARGTWGSYFPGKTIGNFGNGGDTTQDILNRMDPIISTRAPKAFIMAGTNDVAASVSPSVTAANLIAIADQCKAAGMAPIVQSTVLAGRGRTGRNTAHSAINSALVTACATKGYTYIDLNAGGLAPSGTLLDEYTDDGTHLTDAGYQVWVDLINSYV